jgi:Uncharacterized protein with conserved CXXC pairs
LTQIINNKKAEIYLCEQCANGKGHFGFGPAINLGDFLPGFIVSGDNDSQMDIDIENESCDICGMSFEDFRKTGKMGCSSCYQSYSDRIKPILKRLHGNTEHTGKAPSKISKVLEASREIDRLKEMLGKAIQSEEYEKAAELRDRIKELEGGQR